MSAQAVFDCNDLKKEIMSYCLPQYPIITKEMVDEKIFEGCEFYNIRENNWFELGERFPHHKADRYELLEILNKNLIPSKAKLIRGRKATLEWKSDMQDFEEECEYWRNYYR